MLKLKVLMVSCKFMHKFLLDAIFALNLPGFKNEIATWSSSFFL